MKNKQLRNAAAAAGMSVLTLAACFGTSREPPQQQSSDVEPGPAWTAPSGGGREEDLPAPADDHPLVVLPPGHDDGDTTPAPGSGDGAGGGGGGGNGGGGEHPFDPSCPYEVKVHGINPGAFTHVLANVGDVEVWADGAPVGVALRAGSFDLVQFDKNHRLACFDLPAGTKTVRVRLSFDDYGAWMTAAGSGDVDFRFAPLTLELPFAQLTQKDRVILHLDLASSLVSKGAETRQYIPNLAVKY
jgi:hypothetical protein